MVIKNYFIKYFEQKMKQKKIKIKVQNCETDFIPKIV